MSDDEILTAILAREGGYVDHPEDRGGCTNMGITLRTLEQWRGQSVTCDDVRALTETEARAIYRSRYIRPFDGMNLPPALKAQVVDIAVNSGVTTARGLLAQAQKQNERPVETQLTIERLRYYAKIVKARPSQAVFLLGWVNRACAFLTLALVLSWPAAVNVQEGAWGYGVPEPIGTERLPWGEVGMTGCTGYILTRGTVNAAEHEWDGGSFNLGRLTVTMPVGAVALLRAREMQGKDAELVLRPITPLELERVR